MENNYKNAENSVILNRYSHSATNRFRKKLTKSYNILYTLIIVVQERPTPSVTRSPNSKHYKQVSVILHFITL